MVSKLFSSLAKGRGIMMNEGISYESRMNIPHYEMEFHLIRPLKDILDKAILYFLHSNNIRMPFML
jgi:tRNA(Ile)-lysidine synthase TilS/MesJ